MVRRLPAIYAFVIVVELVGLSWKYLTNPPSSSSTLSVALGWGALISMVVMLVYSVARRSRALRSIARLSDWLYLHIFLGVQGMIFALFHSMHVFTRETAVQIMNPAVLNLIAVIIVFSSGIFGRYLYSFIPRTISGERRAIDEIDKEMMAADVASGDLEGRRARSERKIAQLRRADRVFQMWIVLHRPLAAIMYVLSIIHATLSYMFTPSLGGGG
jgi:hypothetical protein